MPRLSESYHPLLTPTVINKLFEKSIFTCLAFIRTSPDYLSKITGLHYTEISQITNTILTKYSSTLKDGMKLYQDLITHCAIIPTGIENFDLLLDGGLMTGNIYELCGFSGCGKTQICMTVSANICSTTQQQVFFIDTKNDLSAQRLFQILETRQISNIGEILGKIQITQVRDPYDLLSGLHDLESRLKSSKEKYLGFKIIILDSLSSLFQRFGNQCEGLSVLNNIANILKYISVEYHLVVLLTNFVTSWMDDGNDGEVEDQTEGNGVQQIQYPALGKYWCHVPNVRIMVKKKSDDSEERFLIILKSLNEPTGKAVKVKIGDDGVT